MRMYSTGETAKRLGVTRDSLHAALRTTAPDAENRIGNRRVFTEEEVERLASSDDAKSGTDCFALGKRKTTPIRTSGGT